MKKNLILLLLSISCYSATAQFKDGSYFQLMVRHTTAGGKYTPALSGFTFNVNLRSDKYAKGDLSWHFDNPTLSDFIWALANIKKFDKVRQSYGSGFFGWHQVYCNVMATDKFVLSPGLSLGDYIFASERSDGKRYEPNGYYFFIGPAVKASYLITKNFMLDGYFNWDFPFKSGHPTGNNEYIKGYKRPLFLVMGVSIHYKSKLFLNARLCEMKDRGQNNDAAHRFDLSLGYGFNITRNR